MKKRIRLFCGVAVYFLCTCNNPVSPEERLERYIGGRLHEIQAEVEQIRGLSFVRPVYAAVLSRDEYSSSTSSSVASSLNEVEDNALEKEYAQMCLIPESDSSFSSTLADYYASFPIAFYKTGTDSLYLIPDETRDNFNIDVTIAHELTHALQDQHFNLNPSVFPVYSRHNSDAYSAIRSVIEGDAEFTEAVYAYQRLSEMHGTFSFSPYDSARGIFLQRKGQMMSASFALKEPVHLAVNGYMPYIAGSVFVADRYHLPGAWSNINSLFSVSTMPRSVAEVNSGTPFDVAYIDYYELMMLLSAQEGDIEFTDDDNGGFSLLHGLYYSKKMVQPEAARQSYGWRGDRYLFVKRKNAAYGTLVWTLAFATEFDAEKCYAHLKLILGARVLNGVTTAKMALSDDAVFPDTISRFLSPDVETLLMKRGSEVWWLENTGTLTGQIITLLEKRLGTSAVLAKKTADNLLPCALTTEKKRAVSEALLRHLLRKE